LLGKLQQELLEQVPDKSEFASGLIHGLFRSLPYLDKDQRRVVEKTLELADGKEFLSPQSTSTTSITAEEEHVEFPLRRAIGKMALESLSPILIEEDEITFSGTRENYCLGFIDMMDSTKTALNLNDLQLSRYYSLFLNAMARIVRNFDGKIIKNAGDCLVYYFPETSDANDLSSLSSVLESGLTMLSAHRALNAKLSEEKLPPLNYRISVEYGKVEVAKSKSSQSDDLFGSTMNICAKINSKAPANGMVIGEAFYRLANQSFFRDNYRFEKVQEAAGAKYHQYPAFVVYSKHKRTILDPFARTSANVWGI
jgi:class 3 adenylate cyclase